ncbi:LysR family transcriptional regulator [Methylobacterium sp. OT2]|uniref:LysR family transcriptional regulator n=1 Tax=Methylobacterium sp. OT2 TaxID=2813779 RepID=UPI00197B92BB|nr:LysR family transcriptional regulator [Methylobacterium sp. OT2]MBN4096001.1 LysR family transcriptional regulator [Methylobacterium sp. OT2]
MALPRDAISERHLRSFRETLRTGSIRGAADRLDVEPSVVTRHIQRLQEQFGVKLLERRGRGVMPTDAAALLAEFCDARSEQEERLLVRLAEAGTGAALRGRVHIVTGEGFMTDLMRWVLGEFCGGHPELEVTLEQASAREVVRLVAQDQAHIGISYAVRPDPPADIVQSRRQPVCVIATPGHPLARSGRPVALREAARYPIAQMTPGFGLQQIVSHAAVAEDVALTTRLVTNSLASLRDFAALGLGIGFMSARSAGGEVAAGRLVALPTTSRILEGAQIHVLARAGRQYGRATREVLRFISAKSVAWDSPRRGPE